MSYKAMCQPQIIIVVQGAGNVDTGLSAQVLYFGRSRFPPRVFDMTGSAHQIEFFVGNKIDKISKVVGHGMKSWNCSYIPGIFLVKAMHLKLFEMVICYVISSGYSKCKLQHCLFPNREVTLSPVHTGLFPCCKWHCNKQRRLWIPIASKTTLWIHLVKILSTATRLRHGEAPM